MFAGTVGVRRLLKLFAKHDIKTTWFIPGHSLETFPEECAMIRDAGHEMYGDRAFPCFVTHAEPLVLQRATWLFT